MTLEDSDESNFKVLAEIKNSKLIMGHGYLGAVVWAALVVVSCNIIEKILFRPQGRLNGNLIIHYFCFYYIKKNFGNFTAVICCISILAISTTLYTNILSCCDYSSKIFEKYQHYNIENYKVRRNFYRWEVPPFDRFTWAGNPIFFHLLNIAHR